MVAIAARANSTSDARALTRSEPACLHCASPIPEGLSGAFCCRGCAEVYALLGRANLTRFYELGGGEGHPVTRGAVDHTWLEPMATRLAAESGLSRILLDVQGLHCSACVWLLEELFRRSEGGAGILVNPSLGTVELTVEPTFPLERYVEDVESVGYRFGPPLKRERSAMTDVVWRTGVCVAIAMNTMIFGFAIYCGLSEGPVYKLFHALDFALSFVSVAVGGSVFFRSAWRSLRRRVLHLDVPIAMGIALVFTSSTITYLQRGGTTSYFDTLNIFIALMLVGRLLQERVLSRNRAMLLASDGAEGLSTRRIDTATKKAELVRCTDVAVGDELLIGHHDLIPVDAELLGEAQATFSLDWISGESAPRVFSPGQQIPAGAFSQSPRAIVVRARSAFAASNIGALLRTSTRRDEDMARATSFHARLTRVYVAAVILISSVAFAGWFLATRDVSRTIDVVAALLIVTCPCAFGIATPLAYEIAQASLRRRGLFVRTPGFLDRAAELRRVVFDKTGTMTTGELTLANPEALSDVMPGDLARMYALAVASSHPKSQAVTRALSMLEERGDLTFTCAVSSRVEDVLGHGMELRDDGHVYRLGEPSWASSRDVRSDERGDGDVYFSRDGQVLARLSTCEELRPDAASEIAGLHGAGYETFILSGDASEKVAAMARSCGVPLTRAHAEKSPEGKKRWLEAHPEKSLFIGDGINDSLIAEAAYAAGTPAIDRPFMASRCDFYFVTPGLAPIRDALLTARRLARVVRMNLGVAIAYNTIAVTLAMSELMTPLVCAVLMPVSSISTVLVTVLLMNDGANTRRSP